LIPGENKNNMVTTKFKMNAIKRLIIIVLFICIFLPWSLYAEVVNKNILPRIFGPLYLGMTEKEFTKVTGMESYACEGCGIGEYTAAVNIKFDSDIYPKYVYKTKADHIGVDCNFYKNKLYSMELPPEVDNIDNARKIYTEAFGPPTKSEDWENGISWLIWEDKKTIFAITYVRIKGEGYPLNQPIGWIYTMEYTDKSLSMQLEKSKKHGKGKSERNRKIRDGVLYKQDLSLNST
jgi:hypothetical protein